jgi:release factor glutamine methyltransferase
MDVMGSDRSIGHALSYFTAELRASGIESARLDAELILGHVTGKDRTRLVIDRDRALTDDQQLEAQGLLLRRIEGASVAYIVGKREFMGLDFAVGPGVLVPRPETELLVEHAIASIARMWAGVPVRVLDVCTGSGAIALTVASLTSPERVSITGSDISPDALAYARKNREALGLERRVGLIEGDLLSWTDGPWDMILTNPPYLTPEQVESNPDLAAEPRLALDGGRNGLELIERILEQAVPRVSGHFAMMIEIDPDQAVAARALALDSFPTADVIILPDLTGRARFISIERQERSS